MELVAEMPGSSLKRGSKQPSCLVVAAVAFMVAWFTLISEVKVPSFSRLLSA